MRNCQQGESCNQMLTVEHGWHPFQGMTEAKTSNKMAMSRRAVGPDLGLG